MSNEDTLKSLGHILDQDMPRDAVHIAVVPVIAAHDIPPGSHVGLLADGRVAIGHGISETIGIIDPFLEVDVVGPGERCWLFLYPGSITALHHHWTHPAFETKEEDVPSQVAGMHEKYKQVDEEMAGPSKRWIQDWISQYGFDWQDAIENAKSYLRGGDFWCEGGTFEGEYVPEEFWEHYQKITGEVVPKDKQDSFFTCAC